MSADVWILVATAVLAVVAISAAVIAVGAARRLQQAPRVVEAEAPRASTTLAIRDAAPDHEVRSIDLEPRVVEGRLIVPPTEQQVVAAAMGRPGVRLSVLAHGVAHALRAESRDRISAIMRREYRRRRRERLQAGRRAIRAAQPTPPSEEWLGS